MSMEQAAAFFAGSILVVLGVIVIMVGLVIVNNIIHKYWKNLGWFNSLGAYSYPTVRYATPEELEKIQERVEPSLDKQTSRTKK